MVLIFRWTFDLKKVLMLSAGQIRWSLAPKLREGPRKYMYITADTWNRYTFRTLAYDPSPRTPPTEYPRLRSSSSSLCARCVGAIGVRCFFGATVGSHQRSYPRSIFCPSRSRPTCSWALLRRTLPLLLLLLLPRCWWRHLRRCHGNEWRLLIDRVVFPTPKRFSVFVRCCCCLISSVAVFCGQETSCRQTVTSVSMLIMCYKSYRCFYYVIRLRFWVIISVTCGIIIEFTHVYEIASVRACFHVRE